MSAREAWLRPEFRNRYPTVPDGRWIDARLARRLASVHLMYGNPFSFPTPVPRVLSDQHFDFRGGESIDRTPSQERRAFTTRFRPSGEEYTELAEEA